MSLPKIGILIGTTRANRFSPRAAGWISQLARRRDDAGYELIDLASYPMPFFEEAMPLAYAPVQNKVALEWAAKLAELDGLIVVTGEYNHGIPAVLKNALDYAMAEYVRKPVAFVGYGGIGAARSIEQLRLVTCELQMAPVRSAVHIGMTEFMGMLMHGKQFSDFPHLEQAATAMLDDLAWWAQALRKARAPV